MSDNQKKVFRGTKFFSQENERVVLASLIKFPNQVAEALCFIQPKFFHIKVNEVIYSMICSLWNEKGRVDPNLLIEKLSHSGFSMIENIPSADYIDALRYISVSEDSIKDYMQELYKYYYLRVQEETLRSAHLTMTKNIDKSLKEIIPLIEAEVQSSAIPVILEEEEEWSDLYGGVIDEIMSREESKIIGLETSYKVFNDAFGALTFGDLSVFAAPPKVGKSTWLNALAFDIARNPKNNCKVFYVDTELEMDRVQLRTGASLTNINENILKKGKFKNDKSKVAKVLGMAKTLEPLRGKVSHIYAPTKNVDEIISLFKRWYYQNVKDGENVLFIYDYLKMTGEKVTDANKEYQIMAEKTNLLKRLVSYFPRTTGVCAIQVNNEGMVAMSSRVTWFASNIYKLSRKSFEELQEYGEKWGSHKLEKIECRIEGDRELGYEDYITYEERNHKGAKTNKIVNNFINFHIENFKVEERGTREDIMKAISEQLQIEEDEAFDKKKEKKDDKYYELSGRPF